MKTMGKEGGGGGGKSTHVHLSIHQILPKLECTHISLIYLATDCSAKTWFLSLKHLLQNVELGNKVWHHQTDDDVCRR